MSKHFLALNIPDTCNPKILTIFDESTYSQDIPVECGYLEIYAPGFNNPSFHEVTPGFVNRYDACALEIQGSHCGDIQDNLPDGIYIIRYSVSPTDKVFVEYNYLRVTNTKNALNVARGNVLLQPCLPEQDVLYQLEEITFIENLIESAKIKVEDQHKPQEGINLLTYAKKRLDKINKKC